MIALIGDILSEGGPVEGFKLISYRRAIAFQPAA